MKPEQITYHDTPEETAECGFCLHRGNVTEFGDDNGSECPKCGGVDDSPPVLDVPQIMEEARVLAESFATLTAERDGLLETAGKWDRASQEGHPSPCNLGSLCPYCEIERLKSGIAAMKEGVGVRIADLEQQLSTLTAERDELKAELQDAKKDATVAGAVANSKCITHCGACGSELAHRTTISNAPGWLNISVEPCGFCKEADEIPLDKV